VLGQATTIRTHLTHHSPNSGEATTFPHIVFSVFAHRTYIRMVFCLGTPKEESRKCLGLEKYTLAKKLLEQVQKWYQKHATKIWRHLELKVGQHMWLNMPEGLAPCFIAKYVRPCEILHKPHFNVYTQNCQLILWHIWHFTIQNLNCFYVMNKNRIKNKKCDLMYMPWNIGLRPKSKAYSEQSKHALKTRSI
jgi:hypothetical protein